MDWDRETIKSRARSEINRHYEQVHQFCLVGTLLGASRTGAMGGFSNGESRLRGQLQALNITAGGLSYRFLRGLYIAGFLLLIALALYRVFVANVLTVGFCHYFITPPYRERGLRRLFAYFRKGCYGSLMSAQFVTRLCVFGWYLLFFIPGVVKSYEYSMVPYILCKNPYLPSHEARRISREMTMGQKWELFVLDLSFWGYALGAWLAGSILSLVLSVIPIPILPGLISLVIILVLVNVVRTYIEATWAQLYLVLRQGPPPPQELQYDPQVYQ